jgi:hypothetical protein
VNWGFVWRSLYILRLLFFLSVHANFSVVTTAAQISLYSISVSSLSILPFHFLFSFWILPPFCNKTWRELGNLLAVQCSCLHVFTATFLFSRLLSSLHYRLVSFCCLNIISSAELGWNEKMLRIKGKIMDVSSSSLFWNAVAEEKEKEVKTYSPFFPCQNIVSYSEYSYDVTPPSLLEVNWHFGRTYCLHLQDGRII